MSETTMTGATKTDRAVLRCEALTRTYGSGATQVLALVDAELEVHAGELVVLRGPSGPGKRTLLNLLSSDSESLGPLPTTRG